MENYPEGTRAAFDAPPMPKNVPQTPPYTPIRPKRRLERSDSPASISSIQPAETISPAKKAAKRHISDNVRVEELVEGDAGYLTDLDVVYPDELEEKTSSADEASSSDDEGDESDTGISQRFQELGCNDDAEEAAFEKKRRESHLQKRASSRLFKRSHSQSVNGDSEVSDVDAMGDHDLIGSARRLRRRVRGPSGIEIYDDVPRSSPEPGSAGLAAPFQVRGRSRASDPYESSSPAASDPDGMDIH